MKNIKHLIFLCLYLISYSVFSQGTIKPIEDYLHDSEKEHPNTYYKDTNQKLQKCVGSWLYDNGSDYFLIKFTKTKKKINYTYNVYRDVLTTKFYYRKNGVVIYDNLNATSTAGSNSKPSDIISGNLKDGLIDFYYTEPSFNDCIRRKHGMLLISVSNTGLQMSWIRETNDNSFYDEPCDNGIEPDNSDFQIPANMILNKVI